MSEEKRKKSPARSNDSTIALVVIGLGVVLLLPGVLNVVFGLIGTIFGLVFGLIGVIFGLVFGLIGTIFGFVFGLIGTIFGFIGAIFGLIFGAIGLWLPLLLIVIGLKVLSDQSKSSRTDRLSEKAKNDDRLFLSDETDAEKPKRDYA